MPRPPAKAESLARGIAAQISDGDLAPGSWLPSERELAAQHDVDRSTVRRAVRILADQNLVTLAVGTGAQVRRAGTIRRSANDVTQQVGAWRGFHVSAIKAGRQPYTHTTVSTVEADLAVARGLGLPTGTPVLQRARIQGLVGELPIQLSTTYIKIDIVDALPILREVDTGPGGMYSRMEAAGYTVHFEESVTCRLPTGMEQERLEITAQQPVLVLWRRGYDQHGRILDLTHRVVVGDRHELVYRYESTT